MIFFIEISKIKRNYCDDRGGMQRGHTSRERERNLISLSASGFLLNRISSNRTTNTYPDPLDSIKPG